MNVFEQWITKEGESSPSIKLFFMIREVKGILNEITSIILNLLKLSKQSFDKMDSNYLNLQSIDDPFLNVDEKIYLKSIYYYFLLHYNKNQDEKITRKRIMLLNLFFKIEFKLLYL